MLKSLDPEKENSTCTHFNMIIECRDMEFLIRLNRDDLIDENVFVFAKIDDLDKKNLLDFFSTSPTTPRTLIVNWGAS